LSSPTIFRGFADHLYWFRVRGILFTHSKVIFSVEAARGPFFLEHGKKEAGWIGTDIGWSFVRIRLSLAETVSLDRTDEGRAISCHLFLVEETDGLDYQSPNAMIGYFL
jgi:hypothetical protein